MNRYSAAENSIAIARHIQPISNKQCLLISKIEQQQPCTLSMHHIDGYGDDNIEKNWIQNNEMRAPAIEKCRRQSYERRISDGIKRFNFIQVQTETDKMFGDWINFKLLLLLFGFLILLQTHAERRADYDTG